VACRAIQGKIGPARERRLGEHGRQLVDASDRLTDHVGLLLVFLGVARPILRRAPVAAPIGLVAHAVGQRGALLERSEPAAQRPAQVLVERQPRYFLAVGVTPAARGTVSLSWTSSRRNQETYLRVIWEEKGGPKVQQPARKGFGSSLIERGIQGATVKREFETTGLRCEIELPLSSEVANGGAAGD